MDWEDIAVVIRASLGICLIICGGIFNMTLLIAGVWGGDHMMSSHYILLPYAAAAGIVLGFAIIERDS